ncbi:MAG: S41 family peptidase [Kiritimatiellia bacterium]
MKAGAALCAVGTWLAAAAPIRAAEAAETPAPADAPAGLAPELCAAVAEGLRLLADNRMAPPGDGAAKAALLEALIRASEPSATFLDEADLAARSRRLSDREWDVGLTLVAVADGLPRVAAVRADSPAAAAEIRPGDQLEKVAGRAIQTGAALKAVRGLLTEGAESALEVGLLGEDGKSRTVAVERVRHAEKALTDVEDLPAGMGYMRAAGLYAGAGAEIAAALDQWRTAEKFGAILDLRGANGTAEGEIPAVAAKFAPVADVLYALTDRLGNEIAVVPAGPAPAESLPLMVLVDEETSGAAELLAAVLAGGVKGAMVIGRETAGDPMIREPKKLSTGRYALLATRQLRTADGTVYAGAGGVAPDVAITAAALDETVYEPEAPVLRKGQALTDEEKEDKALRDRTRNDTYLRRATDVLLGLKALGYGAQR